MRANDGWNIFECFYKKTYVTLAQPIRFPETIFANIEWTVFKPAPYKNSICNICPANQIATVIPTRYFAQIVFREANLIGREENT